MNLAFEENTPAHKKKDTGYHRSQQKKHFTVHIKTVDNCLNLKAQISPSNKKSLNIIKINRKKFLSDHLNFHIINKQSTLFKLLAVTNIQIM